MPVFGGPCVRTTAKPDAALRQKQSSFTVGPMIRVAPLAAVTLRHRAFHLATADSGDIVAVSEQGVGSLIAAQNTTVRCFELSYTPPAVAMSPTGDQLAIVREGALSIMR